jgi:4-amino-4-deoxy-L-arabinose transferase-like glycosyltransferase
LNTRSDNVGKTNSGFAHTMRQPIIFDGTASPVKTALFVILCIAWLLPGLVGHDPWKPDEAMTFGVVHSILTEGHWLMPMIAGVPTYDYPPLYYWTAALLAKLFSPLLPLHDGARLATGLYMAMAIYFTHKTAARLLDERAGRISVMLLLGCLGMLLPAHELNPEVAGLAGMAAALYGMTRIRSEPARGGRTTGLGAGVIALSVGIVPALFVLMILFGLMAFLRDWRNRSFRRGIAVAAAIMLPCMLIYPLALSSYGPIDARMWQDAILATPLFSSDTRGAIEPLFFVRTLLWFGLPALPFAVWLWWRDRAKLRDRIELALPLIAFVVMLAAISFTREARNPYAMVLLLPVSLAAAHALDRLPRGLASFIDAFSLFLFGILAVAFWLYWTAAVSGVPEAAARAVSRQAPGFAFQLKWPLLLLAIGMTLVWLYAVIRAHRNNRRAIVNWVAGITLIWVLLNLLALPAFDHVRSYRLLSHQLANQLPAGHGCVASLELGGPQRASFDYFARLRFVPIDDSGVSQCRWLLTQGNRDKTPATAGEWHLIWVGARPGDSVERFRLYHR